MPSKVGGFWGTAIGVDPNGDSRRIAIFEASGGFRFVDENLHGHPHRSSSADNLCADVAALFGLRNVRLELPKLGIYASAKAPPAAPAKPATAAPKAGPDA